MLFVGMTLAGESATGLEQCADLFDRLESSVSIADAGGSVTGNAAFAPGINGNGVTLAGTGFLSYSGSVFNSASGSVAMWVRKNNSDSTGGLFQIGILGQPNSVGLTYENESDVRLTAFGAGGISAAVTAPGAIDQNDWRHVVAVWQARDGGLDLFLFLDGRFVNYALVEAPVTPSAGQMQVGVSAIYGLANVRVDELRYYSRRITDDEMYAEYVVSANRHLPVPTAKPLGTGPVQVSGKTLLVDGELFTIKGVGYQPTPIGEPISRSIVEYIYSNAQILARDMAMLRAMGANTIRTWSHPPDATLLDACYNGGVEPIRVILCYWVPQDPVINYANPATAAAIEAEFRAVVNQFKSHPALLAWGIGNENNYNYARPLSEWYSLANNLAAAAYEEEGSTYHPCILVNGGLRDLGDSAIGSDDLSLDMIDIWGANIYPGATFHCAFDYFDEMSMKPLVATEYGIDALDHRVFAEYQEVQAAFVTVQWRELRARCLGGSVMAYSDEWWKAGSPATQDFGGYYTSAHPDGFSNEDWWGIVRPLDNGAAADTLEPRQVYFDLGAAFLGPPGDMNCDGEVNDSDLEPFVAALVDAGSYNGFSYPCPATKADVNGDSAINGGDVATFVALLASTEE